MIKSDFVKVRIAPDVRQQGEAVLHELGITPSQAVNMLYRYMIREREWPTKLEVPNDETLKVFKETDQGVNLVRCKDAQDMFKKLGI